MELDDEDDIYNCNMKGLTLHILSVFFVPYCMPKSKRKQPVIISKTGQVEKNFQKRKSLLVEKIQQAVEEYERVFVVELINQRNQELKQIRSDYSDSKFVVPSSHSFHFC